MTESTKVVAENSYLGATSVVGGAGVVGAAVPFVSSWQPSAKAKAAGAPVKVNISKLEARRSPGC